ncbi:hypothetical protein FWG95_02340 [Candidatus Saccharibacteria bacterium]|nr:hypothetical protein [Candidatus Saccharibacteria bacterium]
MRKLRDEERALLVAMVSISPRSPELIKSLDDCLVEDLKDGGMGSIRLHWEGDGERHYGLTLSEAEIIDSDGVPIKLYVDLDTDGKLYELDSWKVDFSPRISYPDAGSVVATASKTPYES